MSHSLSLQAVSINFCDHLRRQLENFKTWIYQEDYTSQISQTLNSLVTSWIHKQTNKTRVLSAVSPQKNIRQSWKWNKDHVMGQLRRIFEYQKGLWWWGWRDGSVAQNAYYSCRRSEKPHGGTQSSVTPVPEGIWYSLLASVGTCMHIVLMQKHSSSIQLNS